MSLEAIIKLPLTQFSILASLDNNRLVNDNRKSGNSENQNLLMIWLGKLEKNCFFIYILDLEAGFFFP